MNRIRFSFFIKQIRYYPIMRRSILEKMVKIAIIKTLMNIPKRTPFSDPIPNSLNLNQMIKGVYWYVPKAS